ncbi:MAG: phospholipase D-like domain-containing protein, partial [Polyangiaceae bacterium]
HEHREALRDAILEARRELIIVSPWLRTAAVDHELLGWLRTSLDRNKELRITVGYGIERDAAAAQRKDPAVRDQEEALRRLREMGDRAHGRVRVVEVGNTHEKLVICDDQYVILTSFNFLSFNPRPGKGLRREMGYRITDTAIVADVCAKVRKALAG